MNAITSKQRRTTRRWLPALMGLVSLTLLGGMSTAQAGIDIRAPFTHVGVDRERGVNVAAPFTRVNVGGHRHHDDRRHYRGSRYDRPSPRHSRGWDRRWDRRGHRHHHHDRHERRDDRGRGFFGRW